MSLSKSRFIEMFGNVATNNKRWKKTKLGNKSVIGSSKRIFANEYTTEGIPFYRSKEIIELGMGEKPSVELYISKKRYQEIKEKFGIPIPGDILMTAVGTIGKFWIVPNSKPFYYKDGNLVYIRTKEFNPLFLKKLLEMLIEKYKVENANGSAYTALTIEKLKDLQIVLPPMTLQKQYEEFHIQIDKSKFLLQKILEKLELLKKSRFIEMFGQCNKEELIGNVVSICRGASPRPISEYITKDSEGINWIKIGDVSDDSLYITSAEEKITKEGASKSRLVHKGDFILSNSMSFGRPYILGIDGCVHDGWLILSKFSETFNEIFLYYALKSDYVQNQFRMKVNGATVKNLNSDLVKNTKIKVPPIEKQMEFSNFIEQIDKSKLVIQKSLEDLVGKS